MLLERRGDEDALTLHITSARDHFSFLSLSLIHTRTHTLLSPHPPCLSGDSPSHNTLLQTSLSFFNLHTGPCQTSEACLNTIYRLWTLDRFGSVRFWRGLFLQQRIKLPRCQMQGRSGWIKKGQSYASAAACLFCFRDHFISIHTQFGLKSEHLIQRSSEGVSEAAHTH